MSNKTQLQTNNTALDGYIARINAAKDVAAGLPEAGGSGGASVETCTVTVISQRCNFLSMTYNSEEGNVYTTNVPETNKSATITVLKNGLLVIMATNFLPNVTISGDITLLGDGGASSHIKDFVFDIKGDGTITIRDDD